METPEILWQQFGAALEMLENALGACPETLWGDRLRWPEFWYLAYHALFWLDHDFTRAAETYAPPPPFTLSEMDPAGLLPAGVRMATDMLSYRSALGEPRQLDGPMDGSPSPAQSRARTP